MRISEAIASLQEAARRYGDLKIVGGYLHDDTPLFAVLVLDDSGVEVWPTDRRAEREAPPANPGVFLSH